MRREGSVSGWCRIARQSVPNRAPVYCEEGHCDSLTFPTLSSSAGGLFRVFLGTGRLRLPEGGWGESFPPRKNILFLMRVVKNARKNRDN